MKTTPAVLACVLMMTLAVALGEKQQEPVIVEMADQQDDCPEVCTLDFNPVCTMEYCDDFRSFPNECARKAFNCKNITKYRTVARGMCLV